MSAPESRVAPWEDFALRVIAIYKFIKASLALMLGLTLIKLIHQDVGMFLHDYIVAPFHLDSDVDSENRFLNWVMQDLDWLFQQAATLTPHSIRILAYANFFYATVFAIEGTGLYLKKHWAEYMVLIVTGSFLPFEIGLIYYKLAYWKLFLIAGNILIIVYLVHRLRLDAKNRALLKEEKQAAETPAAKTPVTTDAP